MVDQLSLLDALPDLLPIVPGCIEGIVSRRPFIVQCPTCGDCYTGVPVTAAGHVPFWGHEPRTQRHRQCLDCWADEGWASDGGYDPLKGGDPAKAHRILDRTWPSRHDRRITPDQARALIATGGA